MMPTSRLPSSMASHFTKLLFESDSAHQLSDPLCLADFNWLVTQHVLVSFNKF